MAQRRDLPQTARRLAAFFFPEVILRRNTDGRTGLAEGDVEGEGEGAANVVVAALATRGRRPTHVMLCEAVLPTPTRERRHLPTGGVLPPPPPAVFALRSNSRWGRRIAWPGPGLPPLASLMGQVDSLKVAVLTGSVADQGTDLRACLGVALVASSPPSGALPLDEATEVRRGRSRMTHCSHAPRRGAATKEGSERRLAYPPASATATGVSPGVYNQTGGRTLMV